MFGSWWISRPGCPDRRPGAAPTDESVKASRSSSRTHPRAFAKERIHERTRRARSQPRATQPCLVAQTSAHLAASRERASETRRPPCEGTLRRGWGLLPGGSRLTPRFQLRLLERAPPRVERPPRRIKHGVVDRDVIHPRNLWPPDEPATSPSSPFEPPFGAGPREPAPRTIPNPFGSRMWERHSDPPPFLRASLVKAARAMGRGGLSSVSRSSRC